MNAQIPAPTTHKKISIGNVISESWVLIRGLKMPIFLRLLLIIVLAIIPIFIIMFAALSSISGSLHDQHDLHAALANNPHILTAIPILLLYALALCFIYPIISATCILLGVRQAVGLDLDTRLVNSECLQRKWPIIGLFFITILISIGIAMFFLILRLIHIPGFIVEPVKFLVTLYCTLPIHIFALPLVITKGSSISEALSSCYAKMRVYWLPTIACHIIILLILSVSYFVLFLLTIITPFLFPVTIIGFIVVMVLFSPMMFACYGILFRDVYGLQNKRMTRVEPTPVSTEQMLNEHLPDQSVPPVEKPPEA